MESKMDDKSIPRLVSVRRLAELCPDAFPEARTRDLIYHAQERVSARGEPIPPNGFGSCVIKKAGRVLVDLDTLPTWLDSGRMAPAAQLAERLGATLTDALRPRGRKTFGAPSS